MWGDLLRNIMAKMTVPVFLCDDDYGRCLDRMDEAIDKDEVRLYASF